MTWTNNCWDGLTNPQSKDFKESLEANVVFSRHVCQRWTAYDQCGLSHAAMLSCFRCMHGWLLCKQSLAFNQAAPLRCVWCTDIIVWKREFIVVAIEWLWAVYPKLIPTTQGDRTDRENVRQSLKDRAKGTSEGMFWNLKRISPTSIFIPDFVYNVYLAMHQHSMYWVTSFLEQHFRID